MQIAESTAGRQSEEEQQGGDEDSSLQHAHDWPINHEL